MFMADDIRNQGPAFSRLARTAPPVWEAALSRLGDLARFRRVVFTGMGSSYFAAVGAASALATWPPAGAAGGPAGSPAPVPAAAELTSALLYYGGARLRGDDLLVAVSQSGESAEVVKLLQQLGPDRPAILAVTNQPESPVARLSDACLSLDVPPDHGVAIKTYGASLLALLWLGARLAGRPAAWWADGAEQAARAVEQTGARAEAWRRMGADLEEMRAVAVVGRGPSLSAAMAGALLFNEVSKVPAWAEEAGEFRHGVIEVAEPDLLAAVVLADGPTRSLDVALVHELAADGAVTVAVAPVAVAPELNGADAMLVTVTDLEEPFMPLVQVVPFQWLSLGWAEARGFEPGRFRNTPGVVRSERKEVTH